MGLPGLEGGDPTYRLKTQVYFKSAVALQQVMRRPRMSELVADVANYSDHHATVHIGARLVG